MAKPKVETHGYQHAPRRGWGMLGGSLACDGGDGDVVARLQRAMVFVIGTGGGVVDHRCAAVPLLTPGYGF